MNNIINTNYNTPSIDLPERVLQLLQRSAIEVTDAGRQGLARHLNLIREWNAYASLVSVGDLSDLLNRHVVDALSLAPYVARRPGMYLDIGSGGGFPAIPLKCLLPELPLVLVERSSKKVGFLRKVVGRLGLGSVTLIQGEFPGCLPKGLDVTCITARAVERPEVLTRALAKWIPDTCTFLCQSEMGSEFGDMFHVERVEDAWTSEHLRRGPLELVRRSV
jgi:16S rRNA (guanine(527)-N(7))-methyltransferase RsmG